MPNSNAWKHAVWQGLDFAVSDPHRYWYMFEPHGAGNESAFTARASGNLNCNQSFSTFERIGGVTEAGEVTGAAGIYSIRELEQLRRFLHSDVIDNDRVSLKTSYGAR